MATDPMSWLCDSQGRTMNFILSFPGGTTAYPFAVESEARAFLARDPYWVSIGSR